MKKYSIFLLFNIAFNLSAGDTYTPQELQKAACLVSDMAKELMSKNRRRLFHMDKNIKNKLLEHNLYNNYITSSLDLIITKQLGTEKEFKELILEEIKESNLTHAILRSFFELRGISTICADLFGSKNKVTSFKETINRITPYVKNPFNNEQYDFIANKWLKVNPEDQDLSMLNSYLS